MLVFVAALLAVFVSFWRVRQPVLGFLIVIFIGSNPFQLYEVFFNENVFGWPVTTFLLVFALHVPLLARRRPSKYYLWIVPVLTGVIIATIKQVRSEPTALILSATFSYLLISRGTWRMKGGLLLLLATSFSLTQYGWKSYFDRKYEEAAREVKRVGGEPYTGNRRQYHGFWHPFWCGLGDFGQEYGYNEFSDKAAVQYVFPILKEKYKVKLPEAWSESGKRTWNHDKKYANTYYELPHYSEVLRDKITHDIANDPLWYFNILLHRLWRIITKITPVRFSIGDWWCNLPFHGIILFPVLAVLVAGRSWLPVKLLCFSFPLALTSFLIYSGGNTTFYSCFHLISAAIMASWLLEGVFLVAQSEIKNCAA
jgi:hypothetical protein